MNSRKITMKQGKLYLGEDTIGQFTYSFILLEDVEITLDIPYGVYVLVCYQPDFELEITTADFKYLYRTSLKFGVEYDKERLKYNEERQTI